MTLDPTPLISVVIPHRGDDQPLAKCLLAIRAQTYPQLFREVIIVLNEESERPLDIILSAGERVLWGPDYYSYSARNRGIISAKGEFIALTDSDTVPTTDWLEEGIRALKAGADIVAGHVELTFSRYPLTPAACYEKLYAFDQEKNASLGRSTTANMFTSKALFSRMGLFSETTLSGDDFRWTAEASDRGSVLRYAPLAKVHHPARESMGAILAKAERVIVGLRKEPTLRGVLAQSAVGFWRTYVLPPSRAKKQQCSRRELVAAHLVGLVVQIVKAASMTRTLVHFRGGPKQGLSSTRERALKWPRL